MTGRLWSAIASAICLAMLLAASAVSAQQDVTFTYHGRLSDDGQPYSGPAQFRFAIVEDLGGNEEVVWYSSDPVTVPDRSPVALDDQPTTGITIGVVDGVFSVQVGDTDIAGMQPIDPSIFNGNGKYKLRVWVANGPGPGERMTPDQPINQASLIGLQAKKTTDIYVNGTTGNDRWPGTQNRPKKTIQAAVDALPTVIREITTIRVADGVYYETVLIRNISLSGRLATLTILGNPVSPQNVRITGQNPANLAAPLLANGIKITDQPGKLSISGVQVDHHSIASVAVWEYSNVNFDNSIIRDGTALGAQIASHSTFIAYNSQFIDCQDNIQFLDLAFGILTSCTITSPNDKGIEIARTSTVYVTNCTISAAFRGILVQQASSAWIQGTSVTSAVFGIVVDLNSTGRIEGCTIDGSTTAGVRVKTGSAVKFQASATQIKNCAAGVQAYGQSVAHNINNASLTFSNNTQNTATLDSGVYVTGNY